jgi:hypothetical protein
MGWNTAATDDHEKNDTETTESQRSKARHQRRIAAGRASDQERKRDSTSSNQRPRNRGNPHTCRTLPPTIRDGVRHLPYDVGTLGEWSTETDTSRSITAQACKAPARCFPRRLHRAEETVSATGSYAERARSHGAQILSFDLRATLRQQKPQQRTPWPTLWNSELVNYLILRYYS